MALRCKRGPFTRRPVLVRWKHDRVVVRIKLASLLALAGAGWPALVSGQRSPPTSLPPCTAPTVDTANWKELTSRIAPGAERTAQAFTAAGGPEAAASVLDEVAAGRGRVEPPAATPLAAPTTVSSTDRWGISR